MEPPVVWQCRLLTTQSSFHVVGMNMQKVRPLSFSGNGSFISNRSSRPLVYGGLFVSPDDTESLFGQDDNIEDSSGDQQDPPLPINPEGSSVPPGPHCGGERPKKRKNELPSFSKDTCGQVCLPPSHFRRQQPIRRRANIVSRIALPPVSRNSVGDVFLPPLHVDRVSQRFSFIASDSKSTPSSGIIDINDNQTSRLEIGSRLRDPRRNSDAHPSSVRLTVS